MFSVGLRPAHTVVTGTCLAVCSFKHALGIAIFRLLAVVCTSNSAATGTRPFAWPEKGFS